VVREGLVGLADKDDWRDGATSALAEFDLDPPRSEVARQVVRHLAMQLGACDQGPFFCLCCVDERLVGADPDARRDHAVGVAVVAARDAHVSRQELAEALAGATRCPPAERLATGARRRAVRARLGRLGKLATDSMPTLASELKALAAEPLPEHVAHDDVWQAVCVHLLAEVGRPGLN
jgi:hypothetical protein